MLRSTPLALAFASVLALAACAVVTAESSFHEKGLPRAVFELGCPADQVQIAVLVRNDGLGCAGSQIGVQGCGKKATYVCDRAQNWVNDSGVVPAR